MDTKFTNIFDEPKNRLDQSIFRNNIPKKSIVKFIEEKIYNAIDKYFSVASKDYISLYLTGSLASFQWNSKSDADITVIVDYDEWPLLDDPGRLRDSIVTVLTDKVDGTYLPGTQHPLQIFVQPPGITPLDIFSEGLKSAWSFEHKDWLVKPSKSRIIDVKEQFPGVYIRAAKIAEKMGILLDTNPKAAVDLYKRVHNKRKMDQNIYKRGDWSEGNIIYKYLDHMGYFAQLRNLGVKIASEEKLSVQYDIELKQINPQDYGYPEWSNIEVFIAYIDNQEAGRISFNVQENQVFINFVGVHEEYRNTNVFFTLLNKAQSYGLPLTGNIVNPRLQDVYDKYKQRNSASDWQEEYNYKKAESDKHCGSCSFSKKGFCVRFYSKVKEDHVCDEWKGNSESIRVSKYEPDFDGEFLDTVKHNWGNEGAVVYDLAVYTPGLQYDPLIEETLNSKAWASGMGPEGRDMVFTFPTMEDREFAIGKLQQLQDKVNVRWETSEDFNTEFNPTAKTEEFKDVGESVKNPAYWKFAFNPENLEWEVWGVDKDGNPHHPESTKKTEVEGHIYPDGCVYFHKDRPEAKSKKKRKKLIKHLKPLIEEWIKFNLDKKPYYNQSRKDFDGTDAGEKTASLQPLFIEFDGNTITLDDFDKESTNEDTIKGEYIDRDVILFDNGTWFNPDYFRKLWVHSFHDKPLRHIFLEQNGDINLINNKPYRRRKTLYSNINTISKIIHEGYFIVPDYPGDDIS